MLRAGLVFRTVSRGRSLQGGRGEVRGEGVRQAKRGGKLGAEKRGAQDVQRHAGPVAGGRAHAGNASAPTEIALQFQDVLREAVRGLRGTPQRAHRVLVGTRGASETE